MRLQLVLLIGDDGIHRIEGDQRHGQTTRGRGVDRVGSPQAQPRRRQCRLGAEAEVDRDDPQAGDRQERGPVAGDPGKQLEEFTRNLGSMRVRRSTVAPRPATGPARDG